MYQPDPGRHTPRGGLGGRGRGSHPGRGGRGGSRVPGHNPHQPGQEGDRPHKGSRGGHSHSYRGNARGKSTAQSGRTPPEGSSTTASEPASESKDAEKDEDDSSESDAEEAEVPIFERTALDLASNPLPPVSTLGATLSKFTNLRKLELANMQPGAADDESDDEAGNARGLETLRFLEIAQIAAEKERRKLLKGKAPASDGAGRKTLADTLTVLNIAGNPALGEGRAKGAAAPFRGLELMKSLFVLNATSCSLRTPPPRTSLINLTELRALILSNNKLTTSSLQELPYLPNLNTLVLSHNEIESLPLTFPANFPQLAKLSVSHNRLGSKRPAKARRTSGSDDSDDSDSDDEDDGEATLPDFSASKALREVRLSHNASLGKLPAHLKQWGRGSAGDGRGLDLLDVGHCSLKWNHVRQLLLTGAGEGAATRGGLKNLTLAGNADVEDEEDYRDHVRKALPGLVVLDNQRFVEKSKRDADKAKEKGKTKKGKQGQTQVPEEDGPAQWGNKGRRTTEGNAEEDPTDVAMSGPSFERKSSKRASKTENDLAMDVDEERGAKKRKRGGRGGRGKKDGAADSSSDEDGDDEHRRRILARAGPSDADDAAVASDEEDARDPWRAAAPAPADGSKKKKRAKRGNAVKKVLMGLGRVDDDEEEGQDSPRKSKKSKKDADADGKSSSSEKKDKSKKPAVAWDEVPSATAVSGTDAGEDKPSDKKANKAQTSVAGIIEVKKQPRASKTKGKQPRSAPDGVAKTDAAQDASPSEVKPAKKPFSLGAGIGAGSGGSSWATGGDIGEGGSAWD